MIETSNSSHEGIMCFGSSIIRVSPDFASLTFEVSSANKDPKIAFSKTKDIAKALNKFLQSLNNIDSRSSNVSLKDEKEHLGGGVWKNVGYRASIQFHVVIKEISKVEEILSGAINAGAEKITSFEFGISSLKEHRALARRNAVSAAIEKAENYCIAAGVKLGEVIYIEDVNPEMMSPYRESHVRGGASGDELPENNNAIDPGSIAVNGAVRITFRIMSNS